MREAAINRKTSETDIALRLNVDGVGQYEVDTGCGFLDHMLALFSRHGRLDLTVACKGDTYVDDLPITIDPQVVDPDDVEMLQDLVMAAVNEALRKGEETRETTMSKMAPGMGGMGGMF